MRVKFITSSRTPYEPTRIAYVPVPLGMRDKEALQRYRQERPQERIGLAYFCDLLGDDDRAAV